jgi:hypothetical protein
MLKIKILESWLGYEFLKKKIKKILKIDKEYNWIYPKKIPPDQKIVFLLENNEILSFIHITKNNNEVEFSFSYTPINHRRKGYNKQLRLYIIDTFKKEGIKKYTSTPILGSNSIPLLESLGFNKEGNQYIQKN